MKKPTVILCLFMSTAYLAECNGNNGEGDIDVAEDVIPDQDAGEDVTVDDVPAEPDGEDPLPDIEPDGEDVPPDVEPDGEDVPPPDVEPDGEDVLDDEGELCDTITQVREAADGPVDFMLCSVFVTYVFDAGYFIQAEATGPAIEVYEGGGWTADVTVGDEISMHVTNVTTFHGTKEIDDHDTVVVESTGYDVTLLEQNLTTLDIAPTEGLESELVRVENGTVTAITGSDFTISYGSITGASMHVDDASIFCVNATFGVLTVITEWDGTHRANSFDNADFHDIDTSACETSPLEGALLINEFLADPAGGPSGDANCDGSRNGSDDEFIEIVNVSTDPVALGGITISDGTTLRHTFADGLTLLPGKVIVVYGGATPSCTWEADVQTTTASEGFLGLNNNGDTITLADSGGNMIVTYTYGAEGGNNESLTLNPDLDDEDATATGISGFEGHTTADTADSSEFSPGTHIDGSAF